METITKDLLATLAADAPGPTVTLIAPVRMPHERALAELQWKQLIDSAHEQLASRLDAAGVDAVLGGAAELLDGRWPTHQRSVAYIGSAVRHAAYAVPVAVDPAAVVADVPAVGLLAGLTGADPFLVLALGLHDTRLLDGNSMALTERVVPDLPTRFDDVIVPTAPGEHASEHRGSLQGIRGGTSVHHGAEDAGTQHRRDLDTFCRKVDAELWRAIGADDHRPVVVAGIGDLVARFRLACSHPDRLAASVEGSADRMTPTDLHLAALDALGPRRRLELDGLLERFRSLHGSGRAGDDPDELDRAAGEGRVETLLIPDRAADDAGVNAIAAATLTHRGTVVALPADDLHRPGAIFRW